MQVQEDKKIKSKSYTRASDMLFKMIEPRVIEIEARFSNGEKLTSEDINTLMLNAQYNHTNHLDDKLNSVVADVASLKGEFNGLKNDFKFLEQSVNNKISSLEQSVNNKISSLEQNVNNKIEAQNLEFKTFKAEIKETIAIATTKQTFHLIIILGGLATFFKLFDKFF